MISECLNALKMKSSSSFLQNRLGFSTRTFAPERIHPGLCFSFSFYTSINCDDLNVLTGAHLPGQHDQGVQDVPPVLRARLHEDRAVQLLSMRDIKVKEKICATCTHEPSSLHPRHRHTWLVFFILVSFSVGWFLKLSRKSFKSTNLLPSACPAVRWSTYIYKMTLASLFFFRFHHCYLVAAENNWNPLFGNLLKIARFQLKLRSGR